jgi:hypothetical protein
MRVLASVALVLLTACRSDDAAPTGFDTVPGADTDTGSVAAPSTHAVVRLEGLELPDSTFTGAMSVSFYWEGGPHIGSPFPTTLAEDDCVADGATTNPTPPTAPSTQPFGGVVHVDLDGSTVILSNGGADLGTWPGGQSLTFSARDGDVVDFALGGFFVVPEPPADAAVEVLVNDAREVTWTGAASGLVYVTVSGSTGSVKCLAADDGSFTVVPSVVASVGAGPQVFVARSLEVVEHLPGVEVTGWAFVSASAD